MFIDWWKMIKLVTEKSYDYQYFNFVFQFSLFRSGTPFKGFNFYNFLIHYRTFCSDGSSKGNLFWKIYVYPDTYERMNTLISRLNTISVAHFLFISYNLEIVKMNIFLNMYRAIYGELFQTQLSLLFILIIAKLLEQYIL